MTAPTAAILHPGEMGASVGAAARKQCARVVWADDGRSDDSRRRAESAGLEPLGSLEHTVTAADVVLSVCPPHAAVSLAEAVAALGFSGVYLDANAVSPATAARVSAIVSGGGACYVDGGIIGPPAWKPGVARLYLSGEDAKAIADIFCDSPLAPIVLDAGTFAASAIKMSYAAWTKGSIALLANVRALATHFDVDDALMAEWALSQPGLEQRAVGSVTGSAFKAWRWIAEMHEIADTFEAAELPGEFHRGAAEVYTRQSGFKNVTPAPEIDAVLASMLAKK